MRPALFVLVSAAMAFAQGRGQQPMRSKIAVYDMASRASRVVFTADQIWEAPNWSIDGKHLLVNSGGKLYLLDPDRDTQTPQPLGLDPQYRCNNDKAFSWDGKLLGFSASVQGGRGSQVFVAGADGSNPRFLTPAAPSYFHGWSTDNKWLSFVAQRDGKTYHLFRVSVDGGPEEQLTTAGDYDDGPEYTPDGKWIYFNSIRSGSWEIWRIPAEGGGPNDAQAERVTTDDLEDWFPHISPDGKSMVWLSFPKGTEGHNGRIPGVQLRFAPLARQQETAVRARRRVEIGGGISPEQVRSLVTFTGGQGSINVNSWAPDSRRFAYVIYEPIQ